jgi:hypothetical protein
MRTLIANDYWIREEIRRYVSEFFARYADDKFSDWLAEEKRLITERFQKNGICAGEGKKLDKMSDEELEQERERLAIWFQEWRERWSSSWISNWSDHWRESESRKKRWRLYLPWFSGSKSVLTRLDEAAHKYRKKYNPPKTNSSSKTEDSSQNSTLQRDSLFFLRLFYAWQYFNKQFGGDADSTINRLEREGLPKKNANAKTQRGSNPLEDLTLLDAMTTEWKHNETHVKECFERQYGPYCVTIAQRKGWVKESYVNLNEADWRWEIYYALVGVNGSKPLAYNYRGEAGLEGWLTPVVRSYFFNKSRLKPVGKSDGAKGGKEYESHLPKLVNEADFIAETGLDELPPVHDRSPSPEFWLVLDEALSALEKLWRGFEPDEKIVLLYLLTKYDRNVKKSVVKRGFKMEVERDVSDLFSKGPTVEDEAEIVKLLGYYNPRKKGPVLEKVKKVLQPALQEAKTPEERNLFAKMVVHKIEKLAKMYPLTENDFIRKN